MDYTPNLKTALEDVLKNPMKDLMGRRKLPHI